MYRLACYGTSLHYIIFWDKTLYSSLLLNIIRDSLQQEYEL